MIKKGILSGIIVIFLFGNFASGISINSTEFNQQISSNKKNIDNRYIS